MKKDQNLDYQDYIKHLVELVKKVKNPESSGEYPSSIHNVRLRGLYDILDKDEETDTQNNQNRCDQQNDSLTISEFHSAASSPEIAFRSTLSPRMVIERPMSIL